jgi:hypothetical protein
LGIVDAASVDYRTDGWAVMQFLTESSAITLMVEDQELADILVGAVGNVTVEGSRHPDGTVHVASALVSAPAAVNVEQTALVAGF